MRIIIDGDILAFTAAAVEPDDLTKAIARADEMYIDVIESCFGDPEDTILYVKGDGNFRNEYDTYKAVRKGERPATLEPVRDYLGDKYGERAHGGEADDYCVMEAQRCSEEGIPYIIATSDKDLRQFPGLFFNIRTQEIVHVTPEEGYQFLLKQCLMGDAVDGIQGLRGIGPKKADKLLAENPHNPEKAILDLYQERMGDEEGYAELEKTYNLVYMRVREEDLRVLPLPEVFSRGR